MASVFLKVGFCSVNAEKSKGLSKISEFRVFSCPTHQSGRDQTSTVGSLKVPLSIGTNIVLIDLIGYEMASIFLKVGQGSNICFDGSLTGFLSKCNLALPPGEWL